MRDSFAQEIKLLAEQNKEIVLLSTALRLTLILLIEITLSFLFNPTLKAGDPSSTRPIFNVLLSGMNTPSLAVTIPTESIFVTSS